MGGVCAHEQLDEHEIAANGNFKRFY